MKRFLARLKQRVLSSGNGAAALPALSLDEEMERIRQAEGRGDIAPGRLIHRFTFDDLELRLDRDVLGVYRVTVSEGPQRLYSFTVPCAPGDYDALRQGYDEILGFLSGTRSLRDLPRHDRLRGHYYGTGLESQDV